jgi:hypothetical protein
MSATAIANGNGTQHLESLRADKVFPGRVTVHAREVGSVLSICVRQVEILKEAGHFEALPVTVGSDRCHYRITVASYDQFIINGGTKLIEKNRVKDEASHAARNGHAKTPSMSTSTSTSKNGRKHSR